MNAGTDGHPGVDQETRMVRRVTGWGIFINVALSVLKFGVGVLGSSQAVVADAAHSLSDLATDFAVLLGVRFWSAPADRSHPYGHRRIETLVTLGIGFTLALVALGIGQKALFTLREPDIDQPGWIALLGPVLSIIFKEWLYRWTVAVGTQVKSPAVVANAWHHRSDSFSSWPVLVAVVAAALNPDWAFIDHVGALVVSMFILKVSWDTIWPALKELSGQGASEEEHGRIEEIVKAIEGISDVHKIRTRRQGAALMVDLHILVPGDSTVREGHDLSEKVKVALLERGPGIRDVVVHIEPDDESFQMRRRSN